MARKNKVWTAGRVPQEELDEIDRCNDCERYKDLFPNLSETCYATKYCHRQRKPEQVSILEIFGMDATPEIPFEQQKKGTKGWIIENQGLYTTENGFKKNMIGVTTARVILDEDTHIDRNGYEWQSAHVIEDGCKGDGWYGGVHKLYASRPAWKELYEYARATHKEQWEIVFTLKDGNACVQICDFETKQPLERDTII